MSLKPKEVRVPCSDELLSAVTKLAERAGLTNGEWARRLIEDELMRRHTQAIQDAADLACLGTLRNEPESRGGKR